MSADRSQQEEIARRWYEAYSARDLDRIDQMAEAIFDQDFIFHSGGAADGEVFHLRRAHHYALGGRQDRGSLGD